jgi:hypothetical protein
LVTAVAESVEQQSAAAKGAVWVFESSLGGHHGDAAATIAVKRHGAVDGKYSGPAGSSYGILTRNDDDKLLPWSAIKNHTQRFIEYARTRPELRFRILPGPQRKSDQEHIRFADLLRNAPANTQLPGRMLEILDRLDTVRIILLDANVTMVDTPERKRELDQYFAANEGLWPAEHIEIVSFGAAQTLVANDRYAKGRGYRHRIINVDTDIYGDDAIQVRELLSVTYATKLICLNDPASTSTARQASAIRFASCGGLEVDGVLLR